MKCLNDRYEISLASSADSAQLLNLYECGDFKGDVSVLYTRRPDPVQSLMNEGEKAVIPIVRDLSTGVIVGMGACIIRKAYINGEIRATGYLTGLKGLPHYRKKVPAISETYRYLREQTMGEVDIFYTTILKENKAASKMLEKKRKNMPEYRRIGEYTVYGFRTGVKARGRGWTLESGSLQELISLDIWKPGDFNFSPADARLPGISDGDVYILKDKYGNAAAACAVWNQQSCKQYIVTGYGGIYRWMKNLPLKLAGYPDLPRKGIPANYASIALLAVKDNNPALANILLRKVAEKASNYDFLMIGLFEDHPLTAAMEHMKCIKYQSILYTVHWEDSLLELDGRPVNLDVGLL
jgi:hypothetical protein